MSELTLKRLICMLNVAKCALVTINPATVFNQSFLFHLIVVLSLFLYQTTIVHILIGFITMEQHLAFEMKFYILEP